VDPKVTIIYKGNGHRFCCKDCIKDFDKDPDKYVKNMKIAVTMSTAVRNPASDPPLATKPF